MTENKTVAKVAKSPLVSMADRLNIYGGKLNNILRKTAFSECRTDEEFMSAVIVANMYKLNPLRGEIYAFPTKKGGVQPIVSVDGWAKVITEHPDFDGMEFTEITDPPNQPGIGNLIGYTCTIWIKGKSHPVSVTEYYEELKMDTLPWKKMKRRMTRHGSMKQCGRVSLGITGIYDEDDMARIKESDAMPTDIVSLKSANVPENATGTMETAPEATNSKDTIGNKEAKKMYAYAGKKGVKDEWIKAYIKEMYSIDSLGDLIAGAKNNVLTWIDNTSLDSKIDLQESL